jgi:predicted RNA binding protein YcfA (HicA-like mRNA interferase family)
MKKQKLLEKVLNSSKNLKFEEFVLLVEEFGFTLSRVRGSHHIYTHQIVEENLNLQNKRGEAISYQVRQFLKLIEDYSLTMEDE